MKPKDRPVMKTAIDVVAALRNRYAGEAYAFLEQVGNATGFKCNRHCDVLVMSLWPSRGLDIIGIEVKVSRGDWLKELADPKKADDVAKYCDYWFVAVGDENIVRAGELPSAWGLMVPTIDGKMRVKAEVSRLSPNPLDKHFVAAVLRQATGQLTDKAKLIAEYERGESAGRDAEKKVFESRRGYAENDLKELRRKVEQFEKASGVRIQYGWDGPAIGDAVRRVLHGYDGKVREELHRLHSRALGIAKGIEAELAKDQPVVDCQSFQS